MSSSNISNQQVPLGYARGPGGPNAWTTGTGTSSGRSAAQSSAGEPTDAHRPCSPKRQGDQDTDRWETSSTTSTFGPGVATPRTDAPSPEPQNATSCLSELVPEGTTGFYTLKVIEQDSNGCETRTTNQSVRGSLADATSKAKQAAEEGSRFHMTFRYQNPFAQEGDPDRLVITLGNETMQSTRAPASSQNFVQTGGRGNSQWNVSGDMTFGKP